MSMDNRMKCFFDPPGHPNTYICIPSLCRFDGKCNGSCNARGLQVNHTDQKYCLEINCKSLACTKNHLLHWRGIHNKVDISQITIREYAFEIYRIYGDDIIRPIIFDNSSLDSKSSGYELMKALEQRVELAESNAFEQADDRYHQQIANNLLERKKKKEQLKMQKIQEQILMGRKMVRFYICLRNAGDVEAEYKQFIKQKFDEFQKPVLFDIIDNFLGTPDEKQIPTFLDL